ncbi:hypothetical protein CMUS01_05578 [Colletotrichum musicola]|uniref:Uncharacterized protein n=1 Tax=Colletotrichum musicola TaxID=2175873 RepID=A0A8H6NKC0_9PEZI|nr:hypothetical protein CMUS01_05578 [Colletotrichum musicola]
MPAEALRRGPPTESPLAHCCSFQAFKPPPTTRCGWPGDLARRGRLLDSAEREGHGHSCPARLSSIDKEEAKGFREIAAAVSHVPSISPFGDRWKTMALSSLEVNLTDSSPRGFMPGWLSADVVPWTTPAIEMSWRRPTDAEQLPDQTLRDLLISCGHVVCTAWLRGEVESRWLEGRPVIGASATAPVCEQAAGRYSPTFAHPVTNRAAQSCGNENSVKGGCFLVEREAVLGRAMFVRSR